MKYLYVRLFVLSLLLAITTGCETLTALGTSALGAAANDGISLDAQVGDKETEVQFDGARGTGDIEAEDDAKVTVTNTKTDSNIENAHSVTVQNIPYWVFFVALLGWVLPTPYSMIKWLWNLIKFPGDKK